MKKMKLYLVSAVLLFLCGSCASTYYYSTVTSLNEEVEQTEDGDFIVENDSLLISYWFNGENAPVYINVYNKTSTPLFVDWTSSSIVKDDFSISYSKKIVDLSGSSAFQSFSGYDNAEVVSLIPPRSRKTFLTYILSDFSYKDKKNTYFQKAKMPNKKGVPVDIKVVNFSERTTPLRFRSYLTLYRTPNSPFSVDLDFYVSRLIKTSNLSPKDATHDFVGRGDLFYIEKESKNKGAGQAALGIGLLVGLTAVDVILSTDGCN